jgi:phospholipid/cholesterol/gamma-HCH transport system ATP-binding protein
MKKPGDDEKSIVRVRDLTVRFGDTTIIDGLSLDVKRGEILGVVGGSGSGKSVLLRTIIGLLPKYSGQIDLFNRNVESLDESELRNIERMWGVMFQHGALFSSLNLKHNIEFQMREILGLSERMLEEMSNAKIEMVGLSMNDRNKMPSELSGGMTKRAALARALALDPEFVLLDEPTSGLDPISAGEFDELIKTLQQTLGLTVFLVTHDLESLYTITDRIAVIAEGKIVAQGTIEKMLQSNHHWVKSYFRGRRGSAMAKRHKLDLGQENGI